MWRRGVQMVRQLGRKVRDTSSVTSTMDSATLDFAEVDAAIVDAVGQTSCQATVGRPKHVGCKEEARENPGDVLHPCYISEDFVEQRNTYEYGPEPFARRVLSARDAGSSLFLSEESVFESAPPAGRRAVHKQPSPDAKTARCELQGALGLVPGAWSELRDRPLPASAQPARMF